MAEFGFKKQIRSLVLGLQQTASTAESTECAEKVEAMLSTAVLHLADLWNMLTLEFSEGVAFDPDTALLMPVAEIPPAVLSAMKAKLENSLQWCQLARSRLRDISGNADHDLSTPSVKRVASFPERHEPGRGLWHSRSSSALGVSESAKFTASEVGVQNVL